MPPTLKILRFLMVPVATLLFVHSVVYGPGQGMTLIPADHARSWPLYFLRMACYGLMLSGVCFCGKRFLLAGMLLASGVLARAILELNVSVLRQWMELDMMIDPLTIALVTLFYLLSFAFPALMCLDCFRLWRSAMPKQHC